MFGIQTEDHIKRSRKIKAAVETPESMMIKCVHVNMHVLYIYAGLKKSIKWSNHHGATSNGATGDRDVLIIVSKVVPTKQNPHIVPRKPKDSLSEGEKKKLKEQGILNKHHDSDLSVMMERYRLDPDSSTPIVLAYEKNTPSRQEVIEKVIDLMKNTNKSGSKYNLRSVSDELILVSYQLQLCSTTLALVMLERVTGV